MADSEHPDLVFVGRRWFWRDEFERWQRGRIDGVGLVDEDPSVGGWLELGKALQVIGLALRRKVTAEQVCRWVHQARLPVRVGHWSDRQREVCVADLRRWLEDPKLRPAPKRKRRGRRINDDLDVAFRVEPEHPVQRGASDYVYQRKDGKGWRAIVRRDGENHHGPGRATRQEAEDDAQRLLDGEEVLAVRPSGKPITGPLELRRRAR